MFYKSSQFIIVLCQLNGIFFFVLLFLENVRQIGAEVVGYTFDIGDGEGKPGSIGSDGAV